MESGVMAGGFVFFMGMLAVLVLAAFLFVAPLKLYSIHREIRRTNDLLQQQVQLLTSLAEGTRFQAGLLMQVSKNTAPNAQLQVDAHAVHSAH